MLEAINLTCVRDERILFDNLCFTVAPGDIVQIEGPNGAGKTSLLRLLAGLSQAEQGEVFWHHQPVRNQWKIWHAALLYLGHRPGVKGVLTPRENLRFWHAVCSEEKVFAALDAVALTGYEDVPAALLSAGQQRRIALARLWLSDATVWILDEPLTALDQYGVTALLTLFQHHVSQGGAVILTTHQPLPPATCVVRRISLVSPEIA